MKHKLNEFSKQTNNILVIDGSSLAVALQFFPQYFVEVSSLAPAVVCCRCSPT